MTASKPPSGARALRSSQNTSGNSSGQCRYARLLGDAACRAERAFGDGRRQRTAPVDQVPRERVELRVAGRDRAGPSRAPEVGDAPSTGRRSPASEARADSFRPHVGRACRRVPARRRVAPAAPGAARPASRRARRAEAAASASRRRRTGWPREQVGERRADEAVAAAQAVVEEPERLVGGERRQPQRHARELHRRRVEVDAVQAALRDEAPEGSRDRSSVTSASRAASLADAARARRRRPRKRHAATRNAPLPIAGSTIAQRENRVGRDVGDERTERLAHEVSRERHRRVEGAGLLATRTPVRRRTTWPAACGRARGIGAAPRRLVVEQRLVDAADLLDAELGVGDRVRVPRPTVVVESASTAHASRSSASRRRSSRGARRGANSRPLNAGTRRSPASQPSCARRDMAWKAAHRPRASPDSACARSAAIV